MTGTSVGGWLVNRPVNGIEVTLVTAAGCHLCDDAKSLLGDLEPRYHLDVREVDLLGQEGVALATQFRAPFPPLLLVDGRYVGHGRVSRRKLIRVLDEVVEAAQ